MNSTFFSNPFENRDFAPKCRIISGAMRQHHERFSTFFPDPMLKFPLH